MVYSFIDINKRSLKLRNRSYENGCRYREGGILNKNSNQNHKKEKKNRSVAVEFSVILNKTR